MAKTRFILNALKNILLVAISAAVEAVIGHIGSGPVKRLGNKPKKKKPARKTTKKKATRKKKGGQNGVSDPQVEK